MARLKGQEVQIRCLRDGDLVRALSFISSFGEKANIEKKQDGFLGMRFDVYDEVFHGWDCNFDGQVDNQEINLFVEAIVRRAQRIEPGIIFNVIRTDYHANGDTPTYTYKNVAWGEVSTNVGSRSDYVKYSLSFSCSERDLSTDVIP